MGMMKDHVWARLLEEAAELGIDTVGYDQGNPQWLERRVLERKGELAEQKRQETEQELPVFEFGEHFQGEIAGILADKLAPGQGDLENMLGFHPATELTGAQHDAVRKASLDYGEFILAIIPQSRESANFVTKLREAMMWANAAIACNEPDKLYTEDDGTTRTKENGDDAEQALHPDDDTHQED